MFRFIIAYVDTLKYGTFCYPRFFLRSVPIRDVIFRKMESQNQTDTNEMATTETKYQTDFYSAVNTNIYLTKF